MVRVAWGEDCWSHKCKTSMPLATLLPNAMFDIAQNMANREAHLSFRMQHFLRFHHMYAIDWITAHVSQSLAFFLSPWRSGVYHMTQNMD